MAHHLQKRDKELIRFLELNRNCILTTKVAAKLFYDTGNERSSRLIAGRRMEYMANDNYIKRYKPKFSNQFIYYNADVKKPIASEHKINVMELYALINSIKGINIDFFTTEYDALEKDYGLRPDAKMDLRVGEQEFYVFCEVDITKKFTNTKKYIDVLDNEELKRKTLVISVSESQLPVEAIENLNIVHLTTDLTIDDAYTFANKINEMLKG